MFQHSYLAPIKYLASNIGFLIHKFTVLSTCCYESRTIIFLVYLIFMYNHIMKRKFIILITLFIFLLTVFAKFFLFNNVQKSVKSPIMPKQERYLSHIKTVTNQQANDEVLFHGSRTKKQIALTFDADMTQAMKNKLLKGKVKSWYNKQIIDILNSTNTKATIFLTGMWIELYPEETKMFAANPLFELGNHSYSHGSFYGQCYGLKPVTEANFQTEMQKTQDLLLRNTGVQNHLFRFPGGCYNNNALAVANNLDLRVIQWDVIGGDGFTKRNNTIAKRVLQKTKNGSIIIFHLHGGPYAPHTAEVLTPIISKLKGEGYEFVKISDLLSQK